jgi:vancomycin resistance protein YoaR
MEYIEPEMLSSRFFGDVLGGYETKHTNNANRNNNLRLACASLDGMILRPGEEFSYNEALGERTIAAGYKGAPAYSGGKTVTELGGGICQVSSTLYYCALLSDLEITVRQNHSYVSNYIPYGMDATVSWGGPDFKFRNNTDYPIRIDAKMEDGYVKIQIMGVDTRDYYIVMEYKITSSTAYQEVFEDFPADNEFGYKNGDVIETPYNGYTVNTYRCRYSKETDQEISRTFEAKSVYKKRDKLIARVAAPTPDPEPTPDPAPTPDPTPDP